MVVRCDHSLGVTVIIRVCRTPQSTLPIKVRSHRMRRSRHGAESRGAAAAAAEKASQMFQCCQCRLARLSTAQSRGLVYFRAYFIEYVVIVRHATALLLLYVTTRL